MFGFVDSVLIRCLVVIGIISFMIVVRIMKKIMLVSSMGWWCYCLVR